MAQMTNRRLLTAEEYWKLEDDRPTELERGRVLELTRPGFHHGKIVSRFDRRLAEFAERRDLGQVVVGDVGLVVERGPDTVRGPDVFFISWSRLPKGRSPTGWLEDEVPELVVEVFSPTDRWKKVKRKVAEYHAHGVDLVWVAHPATRTVHVFPRGAEPRVLGVGDTLDAEPHLPGLRIPVDAIFGT